MDNEKDEVKFSFDGNPGHNNTFVHIAKAIHVNTNPGTVQTTVIIGSEGEEWRDAALREAGIDVPEKKTEERPDEIRVTNMSYRQLLEEGVIDISKLQREIMKYVEAIRQFVKDDKDKLYLQLWGRILEHRAFSIDLYDRGKQDSKFNRNLVGNIMHYLQNKGFYKDGYNASAMTCAYSDVLASEIKNGVSKGADDPARKGLREDPALKYQKAIDEILDELQAK